MVCPCYPCSNSSFYYVSGKCKGKSRTKAFVKPLSEERNGEKKIYKIIAIGSTIKYNFRFVLIFRKDVVIFVILRCC